MPLRIRTAGIEVDVKMKLVGNEIMVPKPDIQMRRIDTGDILEKVRVVADRRFLWIGHGKELATETRLIDPETGKQVSSSEALEILSHYSYKLVDSKGNVVDEKEIGELIEYYYIDENGEEHTVRPFERTQLLDIPPENWVPSTVVDEFVITAVYELYTDKKLDVVKLWELAEKMLKEDKVGVATYSHGRGFVSYYAFLCPIMADGKFGWLLKLTDTKMRLNHLMETPAKIPIPVKQAPTLERLPPVQLIVATAKKKKQQQTS
ncbi:hypothetical protein KEJ37_00170 [Candidatus Bathyarchaeota archaeon]|nr:hypothetical protein [Candidatus Bathyarchaeota archaeon]